jgi:hypothetical protein
MTEDETALILGVMSGDYKSKTILMRELRKNIDEALSGLLAEGFIEGISLSGGEVDHFKLTEKGRRRRRMALAARPDDETRATRGVLSGLGER